MKHHQTNVSKIRFKTLRTYIFVSLISTNYFQTWNFINLQARFSAEWMVFLLLVLVTVVKRWNYRREKVYSFNGRIFTSNAIRVSARFKRNNIWRIITIIWWNPLTSKKPKTKDYKSDMACAIGNKIKVFLGTNVWTVRYIL